MKNLQYILSSIVLLAVVFTGCDSVDFGDINQDDDVVTEANTEGLMAGAMNRYATLGGRDYLTVPSLYVQYQGQSVYTTEQRYGSSSSSWQGYYQGTLSNLNEVVEITTADEIDEITKTYGAPVNQANVAELMSVLVWKRVTDVWGPVPYTNALGKGETIAPAYTEQETIYKDLIERAKAARDALDPSKEGPSGDPFYGGDVMMWKKFANSFIMDLSMSLAKKYPNDGQYADQQFEAALNHSAGIIDEVSEEMWYDYNGDISGMGNPYATTTRGADYYLSDAFTDAMKGATADTAIAYSNDQYDARLQVFSTDSSADGVDYGTDNGGVSGPSAYVTTDPGADLHYFTAAKSYLLRAEAAERGWTNESASTMLQTGIEMSYASMDAHYDDGSASSGKMQSDGTQFALDRVADATTANGGMMQVIMEELWAAQFPMGFQAWTTWRRTDVLANWSGDHSGYPGLLPSPDAINNGEIPRRYIYPGNESGVNSKSYNNAIDLLSPSEDGINSRFWWDKN